MFKWFKPIDSVEGLEEMRARVGDMLSEGLGQDERGVFRELLESPSLDPQVRERLESILGGEL